MIIIEKNINELKEYENNPRKNDRAIEVVAKSIKEFGFKVPVVVDKDNIIVTGHTRVKAAISLGIKSVPCIVADDLTEEQIKAFRLVDNKTNELATWDFEKLEEELKGIEGLDMSEFEFEAVNEIDIDEFFEDSEPKPKIEEPKEITCPHCGEIINLDEVM